LNKVVSLDRKAKTVTVEGGIKYGELAPYLHTQGFALANLASLPHISVGGSITTATHGSGVKNGNLSSAVSGLEVVIADGSVINFAKHTDAEKLNAINCWIGCYRYHHKSYARHHPHIYDEAARIHQYAAGTGETAF
jgi:xylitol oxidase